MSDRGIALERPRERETIEIFGHRGSRMDSLFAREERLTALFTHIVLTHMYAYIHVCMMYAGIVI